MWNGISFSENYYLKTSPVSLQFNELISIQKALRMLPSIQTQNNLEWTLFWRNRLPPSSECLLKMQTVYSSETLLARPHVILTYTTLCLFTTVKNWSKKPTGWFMQDKNELQVHIMFWTNTAWHNVAALCTTSELRFLLPLQTKNKVKGYNTTKAARHSKMQKVMRSTYTDRFTVNTNTQGTCNSQNKMKQIWQLQFVSHSSHDFQEFNGAQTEFCDQPK